MGRRVHILFSTILCLGAGLSAALGGSEAEQDLAVFDLREISGLDVGYGHPCPCGDEPDPHATYPAFSSAKPLYSEARVDMELGDKRFGVLYRFAMDESGGTGAGYDRLYIDLDRDGDLTDEKPREIVKDPSGSLLAIGDWVARQVCFAAVDLPGQDGRSVHVVPCLRISKSGPAEMRLFPTQARRGEIEIAGLRFDVTLGQVSPVGTRWDRPSTLLELRPQDPAVRMPMWFPGDRLLALHKIGGSYWRLSTTPEGNRLFVEPYRGDFGTFTLGSAKQFVWNKGFQGPLLGRDRAVLAGKALSDGDCEPLRTCEIPVGDYTVELFGVFYGPLFVSISSNYHADGRARGNETTTYPFQIRKDKPCVLDFSDRAEVLFASPAKDTRIKPGDEFVVKAVLVDPKFDIMIRDLRRIPQEHLPSYVTPTLGAVVAIPLLAWLATGRSRRNRLLPLLSVVGLVVLGGVLGAQHVVNTVLDPKGPGLQGYDRLDPHVVIVRSNGEIVAQGTMPFG